jgi:putative transposase
MARKRHSPESIAALLRKAESGTPIAQLARQAGVHENTIHLWKKKYERDLEVIE